MTVRVYVHVPLSPSPSVSVPETKYEVAASGPPTVEIAPVDETLKLEFGTVVVYATGVNGTSVESVVG